MSVEMFAPAWYYVGDVNEEYQKRIEDLFKPFISNDDNFSDAVGWNCNVQTSFQHANNGSAPWTQWLECLRPQVDEFMDELQPLCDIEIIPQEAWVNKYHKGDHQEYHDHAVPQCNLSMVYFHTLTPGEMSNFKFYNNSHSLYKSCGLVDVFNLPTGFAIEPKIRQGSLVIFPSFYPHYVTPNNSDHERVTLSGNFWVVPDDKASAKACKLPNP